MADPIQLIEFNDTEAIAGFEKVLTTLEQIDAEAKQVGVTLEKTFNPQDALGVADAVRDIRKEYDQLKNSAAVLRTALKNTTDPTAIRLYETALNDLEKGMKDLEKTAKVAGVALKDTNKQIGTGREVAENFFGSFAKAALITVAIEKVIAFTKYAVGLATQLDKAQKAYTAFTGSESRASQVIGDLTGVALRNVQDIGEVLETGQKLLAFGLSVDKLAPALDRVSKISRATGKDFNELAVLYGKARTAGVLYAEDINQLLESGIPIIGEFAKQLGISESQVKKLGSEGKISFEELQLAFFNLTKEGTTFSKLAIEQANTLPGLYQSAVNKLRPLLTEIGTFFSNILKNALFKINNYLDDLTGEAQSRRAAKVAREITDIAFDTRTAQERANGNILFLKKKSAEELALEQEAINKRRELAAQGNDKLREQRRKAAEQEKKDLLDLQNDLARLRVEATADGESRERAEIERKYAELQKIAIEGINKLSDIEKRRGLNPEEIAQREEFGRLIFQLETQRLQALLNLSDKYEQEILDKELDAIKKKSELALEDRERLVKQIEDQRALAEEQINLAEVQGEGVIRSLEANGTKEEKIKQAQLALDELIQKKRLENTIAFNQRLLQVETDPARVAQLKAEIETLQAAIANLGISLPEKKGKGDSLSIFDLLGIEDPGKQDALKEVVDQIVSGIEEITEAQVRAAEERTRIRDKELQEAEDRLKKEEDRQKQGLSNNVTLAREEIAIRKKLRDEAFEQEKKAQRQQLSLDTATQASGLITASANIFKTYAGIPGFGLPLAIGLIATMIGAFTIAKVRAFEAINAQSPNRKGRRISGKTHEQGGEPIIGIDGKTYAGEKNEWLIGTEPSMEHDKFLTRLNAGEFKGVNLNYVLAGKGMQLGKQVERITHIREERAQGNKDLAFNAMVQAYKDGAKEIVTAINEKTDFISQKDGYIEVKRRGRNTEKVFIPFSKK